LGFSQLNYAIVGLYPIGVAVAGAIIAGEHMPWRSARSSIFSSVTSTPAFGCLIPRLLVSIVLLKGTFILAHTLVGDLKTVMEKSSRSSVMWTRLGCLRPTTSSRGLIWGFSTRAMRWARLLQVGVSAVLPAGIVDRLSIEGKPNWSSECEIPHTPHINKHRLLSCLLVTML